MIKFENVTFSYGEDSRAILNKLNLSINSGEQIAIMGGNGSGKTTLGMLMCGLLRPQAGTISIKNKVESGIIPGFGFLFQDPDNALVATTVEREIAFTPENLNYPQPKIERIVNQTLMDFGLEIFRDRLVWNLSGGEKQRLSLAGVFAAAPKILFLDEPSSYLDFNSAQKLDTVLEEMCGKNGGITIIRVTQYPSVAEKYSRVLIIDRGQVVKDDCPDKVFSDLDALRRAGLRPPLKYLIPLDNRKTYLNSDRKTLSTNIEKISFSYGSQNTGVLNDLTLTINRGEVIGLAGESGSGKSTLAQILCGIYKPDKGRIRFQTGHGRAVMSFQQPERQFFLDTVYNEVAYGIKNNIESSSLLDKRVKDSLKLAGLTPELFVSRDPHTLSGGEARRLAFAIVLALEYEMIIFDEPTCGLDENGIRHFSRMVRRLKSDDKAILIISHNGDVLGELADRMAFLQNGKIEYCGDTLEFFKSSKYRELLSPPEVIAYQVNNCDRVLTSDATTIFDLDQFIA
ncbi:MAG: energy-coupling factor transporter ATPase [Candidatus Zixiibacteriota bacterium]